MCGGGGGGLFVCFFVVVGLLFFYGFLFLFFWGVPSTKDSNLFLLLKNLNEVTIHCTSLLLAFRHPNAFVVSNQKVNVDWNW